MLQAIIKKGKVLCEEVPAPMVSKKHVLIRVMNSCISPGTELANLSISGKSLIKRGIDQPENLRRFLNLAQSDGIIRTYKRVKDKHEGGQPIGYSLSGVVVGVGREVTNFLVGERVAAAGAGVASHAEYVDVPENLVVKLPKGLDFAKASSVALGAIALHGVRRASLKLGEYAVVMGTGVLGLLCIQMLRVSGTRVAAIDLNQARLKIAKQLGAEVCLNPENEDPVSKIINWSDGFGVDAVLFTAATKSSETLSQSFRMCKKKGRVTLVGVSGMSIKRQDLYEKELDFLISTSYGPGRYDRNYEQKGLDYPYAYVRWTENRNMIEYLRLVDQNLISLDELISATYPIQEVSEAFAHLANPEEKPLLIILDYGEDQQDCNSLTKNYNTRVLLDARKASKEVVNVALVGSGNFAESMHVPNLAKLSDRYNLHAIVNRTGYRGKTVAKRYKASYVTTDYTHALEDRDVDLIMISTRHDSHAELVLSALEAGKNVFVEKPLATTMNELKMIKDYFTNSKSHPLLMVGFNRRFSKYSREIKRHTENRINPLVINYRMNAGFVPSGSWIHEDGGRIIGEACHIIDLITYFVGCPIKSICYEQLAPQTEYLSHTDNKSIILKYEDGSLASIQYFSVGNIEFSKEYMEIHYDGKTIVLDDYKKIKGYGLKISELSSRRPDKGHLDQLKLLYDVLTGKDTSWPIELWDIIQTTSITISLS